MDDNIENKELSGSLNSDEGNDDTWHRIKDLLFREEMKSVVGAIESTNKDIQEVDKTSQSEIEDLRSLLIGTIRFEVELLSQDIVNRDIQTQEKLTSVNSAIVDLDHRISLLENRLNASDAQREKVQNTLNKIDEILQAISKLRLLK